MIYKIIFITSILSFFFISICHASDQICEHTDKTFNCVHYVKNYDADTVTFNINGIHPFFGKNISVRVNGVDTPEVKTKDTCEKELALKAKQYVKDLFLKSKRVDLRNIKKGKYFRIVADIYLDNQNLSTLLLDKKYAYKYDGGTKLNINWCNTIIDN